MSRSLIRKANAKAAKQLVQDTPPAIETLVTDDKIAAEIYEWLASLKLLHGVPFHYIVPDEDMLPQESIRFFNLDINWVNSLVDGAYSIGRNEVSRDGISNFTNCADHSYYESVHKLANNKARSKRFDHLGLDAANTGDTLEVVTGFLLRSEVVSGWKGVQVNAFDKENSEKMNGDPVTNNDNVETLSILRFEHLSDQVLLGIFEGDLYQLDIHEPSEGLHFGFDLDANHQLMKYLKDPDTGDRVKGDNYVSNEDVVNHKIFRDYIPQGDNFETGSGGEVVNMFKLSTLLFEKLNKAKDTWPGYTEPAPDILNPDKKSKPILPEGTENENPLVSSDFAIQMVEGAAMVSFYKNINP